MSREKVKVVLWDLSSCDILDAFWTASGEQSCQVVQERLVLYIQHVDLRYGHDGF